jgi:HEAT repeat protein
VVIRRSASDETRQLVSDLAAAGPGAELRRESAIARLRVIGARAVRYILPLVAAAPSETRVAALGALEGRGEAVVVAPVLDALLDADPDVRVAALGVARGLLDGPRGAEVLDRVTGIGLDSAQPLPVRRAAIAALGDLPSRTLRPVIDSLRADADPAVRALVARQQIVARDPAAALAEAAEESLPADPDYVLSLVGEAGAEAPLPTLHRLVGILRDRERAETRADRRRDWLTVRGAVHQALAARGSRVAAYDLREALETAADPLPDGFVRAASAIGDAPVLEALAGAFTRAARDAVWRAALADAARAIVARERLSSRHAVVKRLRARWGDAVAPLLPR